MKKLAALGFIAALLTSCLPVPFDLTVSQGAASARRMTRDNGSLLTINQGIDPSAHDFVFYPSIAAAGLDYSYGFVVSQRDLEANIAFVKNNALSGNYDTVSQFQGVIGNPDPHAPPFSAWPVKSGPAYLLGFAFDAVNPLWNLYSLFWGNPATFTLSQVGNSMNSQILTVFGLNAIMIGASVSADPSAGYDMIHWLGTQSSGYVEFIFQGSSAGLAFPPNPTPRGTAGYGLSFIPAGLARCTYFYDDNQSGDPARLQNRSFASWWDSTSSSWVSYAWWQSPTGLGSIFSMRLPVDHRLDALLSTGQLLSTEGGTGRLYDRDGNLQATFPLGNLIYIAEEYVGGVPRCYFSQCLVYDNKLHFNVYWIQTDQLSSLGN
jgi:hypothetical protein